MITARFLFCQACVGFACLLPAQQVLFPGLEGAQLQEALKESYRPVFTLTLSQAKDTLYTIIDNVQDSVECIYSGYTLHLPDGVDASQWLFMNGSGINLEHVYPQSKGADEGMAGHSDMHHLHPSRVAVNEARASFPFMNIDDQLTTKWYRDDQVMQSIPLTAIDAYSEFVNGAFEPRESVKGNIARAVFYFYTMYQEDADAADPQFFPSQRPILCQWHLDDAVDDAEHARSAMVAHYQDGKENPFVLDCTAALRAWCPEYDGCPTTAVKTSTQDHSGSISAHGNAGRISVFVTSGKFRNALISVYDITGRKLAAIRVSLPEGATEYVFEGGFFPGIYTITCQFESSRSPIQTARCAVY